MVDCNVATLGEGDWNYGKLQNVEFGGFKDYGNNWWQIIAELITGPKTGLWVILILKSRPFPPQKTTNQSLLKWPLWRDSAPK